MEVQYPKAAKAVTGLPVGVSASWIKRQYKYSGMSAGQALCRSIPSGLPPALVSRWSLTIPWLAVPPAAIVCVMRTARNISSSIASSTMPSGVIPWPRNWVRHCCTDFRILIAGLHFTSIVSTAVTAWILASACLCPVRLSGRPWRKG